MCYRRDSAGLGTTVTDVGYLLMSIRPWMFRRGASLVFRILANRWNWRADDNIKRIVITIESRVKRNDNECNGDLGQLLGNQMEGTSFTVRED